MRPSTSIQHLRIVRCASGLALLLAFGLYTLPATAADSAAASAAVAKLLSLPTESGSPTPERREAVSPRASVIVLKGEHLGHVIRRTMAKQPFKEEFLRKAFIQLNPQLPAQQPLRSLKPGTSLLAPNSEDLLALLAQDNPGFEKAASAASGQQAQTTQTSSAAARRHWVRFP